MGTEATATTYQCGSNGETVEKIQRALASIGYYQGPIDGIYGGGTASAVTRFQKSRCLPADGCVGSETWSVLFQSQIPAAVGNAFTGAALDWRCLALTGSFETGMAPPDCFAAVSGNFDGQGMSFGALQWNMGQGTLQPLLSDMVQYQPDAAYSVFGDRIQNIDRMLRNGKGREWAEEIQTQRHQIIEPWKGMFAALGRTKECQMMQIQYAKPYMQRALYDYYALGLNTERGVALLFDIAVQCGGVRPGMLSQLEEQLPKLSDEADKLWLIANCVAEAVNPRWVEDVRTRKLAIANGTGVVHGRHYDLEAQYGIRLSVRGIE